jgi:hypothetical protein
MVEQALPAFEPFVSPVVLEEIGRGDPGAAKRRRKAVSAFRVLEVVPEVRDLAEHYFAAIDLPEKARADAYHLALAVWHGMDYLVVWNCTHIAGGKVKLIVQRVNAGRALASLIICTPEELMEIQDGYRPPCSGSAYNPQRDRAAVPGRRIVLPAPSTAAEGVPQTARATAPQESTTRPGFLSSPWTSLTFSPPGARGWRSPTPGGSRSSGRTS